MGGIGSGRRNQGSRATTSDRRPLDIRRFQRKGLLTPGQSFIWQWTCSGREVASIGIMSEAGRLILHYRDQKTGGESREMQYPVQLEWTDCHLGGQRAWLLCPAQGCGRRVAILYAGSVFACRHCNQLAYACQRETLDDRAARRADTIRRRLGWDAGILNGEGIRPKGMHRHTYERLRSEHNAYVRTSITEMRMRFRLISHELDNIGIDLDGVCRGG